MNLVLLLKDERFNVMFSFILGIGLICLLRPMCTGPECNREKAPNDKDFNQVVYRHGEGCYEFQHAIVPCPPSGAIEAFGMDNFARRATPIASCD